MPSYKYIVLTNPRPGCEAEFNRWYDERHLPDVMKTSGIVSAQRYEVAMGPSGAETPIRTYLTIFEIDTADLPETVAELMARVGTDAMPISEALDTASAYAGFYKAR